jgi:hypothetical protein
VESLDVLNGALTHSCQQDLQRQLRGKTASKSELLAEERLQHLRALPVQTE